MKKKTTNNILSKCIINDIQYELIKFQPTKDNEHNRCKNCISHNGYWHNNPCLLKNVLPSCIVYNKNLQIKGYWRKVDV